MAPLRTWLQGPSGRRVAVILAAVVIAAAGAVATLFALLQSSDSPAAAHPTVETATGAATAAGSSPPPTAPASPTAGDIRFAGLLDGAPMTESEWLARKDTLPLAVMVDNSPSAYPQSGLDRADLVYEAFVEGGITRFMAVFWRQDADAVSPVRSARTPFVVWASELGALYGHAGGAVTGNEANAIGQIYDWNVRDLDAFLPVSDVAYYRSSDRYAPYNLVGVTKKLRTAAASLAYGGPSTLAPWRFKADGEGTASAPAVGAFEVNFQERRYAASVIQWHWDETSRSWLRYQSGGQHKDAVTGRPLAFKNVIVMRVPWDVVDFSGHVLLQQFGEGPATVFLDGRAIEGTWRKKDRLDRTRFYDRQGLEIALNRGPIFIEAAGPASLVTTAARAADLPPIPPYEPPIATGPGDDEPAPVASPSPSASASPRASASPSASASRTAVSSPTATATPTVRGTPTPPTTPTPTPIIVER
ncbi:MAG: DUF3048 domain-containing protein [Dehalococcoidia bacterium]|nr:DUF3048 domain-containing protein [Dehalococcoidia bacterium]